MSKRYIIAIADWKDMEVNYYGERRGWVRHHGIYDRKLKRFAPGASSFEKLTLKNYKWYKCRNKIEFKNE